MTERPVHTRPTGVSVVIPTFNRCAELRRAIDSVTSLAPERTEILVIDDGSTDSAIAELSSLNAHGVPLRGYRQLHNRGPQAARNLGMRRARFSHIAFLDSDDRFRPGKVDAVLDQLALAEFDLLFHAVEGMPRYATLARLWQRHGRGLLPFHWLLALFNPAPTPSLVVRRRNRLGPPHLRHAEDWAFLMRYARPGQRVVYLDRPLAEVSRPAGSAGGLSAAAWRMRRGEFSARRVLLKSPAPGPLIRFGLGSLMGVVRVFADLLRGRYWRRGPVSR